MKTIENVYSQHCLFNHLVYDNCTDKHFAKHSHAFYEMIYILRGEVDYIIEDRLYQAKKNSLILIKPYTYHYFTIRSECDYEKIGVLFDQQALQIDVSSIHSELEIFDVKKYPILLGIFQKLDYYKSHFSTEIFLDLLHSLIKEICFNLSLIEEPTVNPQYRTPILSSILQYINANLFSIHTLEDVSSALRISTSYLKAVFKKELKTQPKRYINEKKLLLAQQLIRSGEKTTSVCEQCGFINYSTFFRAYQEYFGVAPSKDVNEAQKMNH